MKEEEQTENRQRLKQEDAENKKVETNSEKNKPKEILLKKDERERNIGETKPQNITKLQNVTEESEKEIWM